MNPICFNLKLQFNIGKVKEFEIIEKGGTGKISRV